MAKKKTISSENIIAYYMNHVLEHNEQPKSVYAFAKANNFEESLFYKHFSSFKAIEKGIFKSFHNNTLRVLHKSSEYKMFDQRNKLLSYYFTFFENLTANRSYVLYALGGHKKNLESYALLSDFKSNFTHYIQELDINLIDVKQEKLDKVQNRGLKETAWFQLLLTLKFWMNDESQGFEKTDIFIEKSVNTSFDVLNVAPLKSLIDFGKFIYKEKINLN